MKKILILMALWLPMCLFAQNDAEKKVTKYEKFSSKTGSIVKFVDYELPRLYTLETCVRCVISNNNSYFYRLERPATSSSYSQNAFIEYSDLVEINKAIAKLSSEEESDIAKKPDYMENKFISDDGFVVGYYSKEGFNEIKSQWFIRLERGGTTITLKKDKLIETFTNAQKKIEELQKSGK